MKPSELNTKKPLELEKLAHDLKEEIFHLRFKQQTGQLKQTVNIRNARRDLARIMTALRQKQRDEQGKEAR